MNALPKYEIRKSEKLGRYLVAGRDLRAGETVLIDKAFVLGPHGDSSLVCFNCCLPLVSKFLCCKRCDVAPLCPGEGCPQELTKWHDEVECGLFLKCRENGINAMTMVQNVNCLATLRAILKMETDPRGWEEFVKLETHLEERRGTDVWKYTENNTKFIESLGLLKDVEDKDLVQKICGAIDVNSFEVRGPPLPTLGCSEEMRGLYLRASLIAHDCVPNTQLSINDSYVMTIFATIDIKKGEPIYNNYTDSLKGTAIRQKHLLLGKYFVCTCSRCVDPTEMGTHMSSLKCRDCKIGFILEIEKIWSCQNCKKTFDSSNVHAQLKSCSDKLRVINKRDEKELEEYIRNVSIILAPNHYLLLEAKQRLAGVLRDTINREPHPTKRTMKRKIELCQQLLPVLEKLSPGISRIKAITMYELHATMVQLAKKLFDVRELSGSAYLDQLLSSEKFLKRSLEMLLLEPRNSPEGELCVKAIEEYRGLKIIMSSVLDGIHAEGKTYIEAMESEELPRTT